MLLHHQDTQSESGGTTNDYGLYSNTYRSSGHICVHGG